MTTARPAIQAAHGRDLAGYRLVLLPRPDLAAPTTRRAAGRPADRRRAVRDAVTGAIAALVVAGLLGAFTLLRLPRGARVVDVLAITVVSPAVSAAVSAALVFGWHAVSAGRAERRRRPRRALVVGHPVHVAAAVTELDAAGGPGAGRRPRLVPVGAAVAHTHGGETPTFGVPRSAEVGPLVAMALDLEVDTVVLTGPLDLTGLGEARLRRRLAGFGLEVTVVEAARTSAAPSQ